MHRGPNFLKQLRSAVSTDALKAPPDQDAASMGSEHTARMGAGRVEAFLLNLGITPTASYAGMCMHRSIHKRTLVQESRG